MTKAQQIWILINQGDILSSTTEDPSLSIPAIRSLLIKVEGCHFDCLQLLQDACIYPEVAKSQIASRM